MPPSESNHTASPWPRRILRGFLLLINLFLLLVFLVQGALIAWLWPDGEIDLPQSILEKINGQLAQEGLHFQTKDLELDLRGYIAAKEVTLGFTEGESEAFSAERILIGFEPWDLLIGHFTVDEIRIIGGKLDCSPVVSPTGVRETVVHDIYMRARKKRHTWSVDNINFEAAGFRVAVHGKVPAEVLSGKKKDKKDDDISAIYHEACRYIIEAGEETKALENPLLLILLEETDNDELALHANFQSDACSFPNGASIGPNMTHGTLVLGSDQVVRASEPVAAMLHDLEWPEIASCPTALLLITLHQGEKGALRMPDYATLYLARPQSKGLTFDGALALADLRNLPVLKLHADIKEQTNWMESYGNIDILDQTADMHLDGRWDPEFFLQASAFAELKTLPDLEFAERPYFRAHVVFDKNWVFNRTWIQLDSGPTRYETLKVESLFANTLLVPGKLDINKATINTKDYSVSGSYTQDLKTNDYRFLLDGTVRPLDIAFLIDEEWWNELWKDFQFKEGLPNASLDFRGRYGGGRAHKEMFCRATIPACSYRGVPVTKVGAYLWQRMMTLDILDLFIQSGDGNTLANLQFLYVPKGDDRRSLAFTGNSTMPPANICTFIGPEAAAYGDLFTSQTPPRTLAAGIIFGKDSSQDGDLYLNIDADFPAETVFDDIIFDKLALEVIRDPQQVSIKNINAVLAGGQLTGNALLTESGETKDLQLDLELKNASLYGLFTKIPALNKVQKDSEVVEAKEKAEGKATGEAKSSSEKDKYVGIMDVSFKGGGNPDVLADFNGEGKASLRDAHLGRLHLFGGLSRLLDGLGIGFGTVDFTAAQGNYLLTGGNLHIPNAEITGPTARIDANGYYYIKENNLDFILSLYPLGGISVPVVEQVLSVLDPISNTIEVELKGPIDDPKWSTSFRLMRAFTGQQKVQGSSGSSGTN